MLNGVVRSVQMAPARVADQATVNVLFVAHQSGRSANGGLESLLLVIERLTAVKPVVLLHSATGIHASLVRRGIEVVVLNSLEPANPPVWVSALPVPRQLGRLFRLVRSNWQVALSVRRRRVAVVHCNDSRSALSSALGARLAGAAVVLNVRDTVLRNRAQWVILTRLVHQTIVLSEDMAARVQSRLWLVPNVLNGRLAGFFGAPMTVSRSVVDPTRFSPLSAEARRSARAEVGLTPSQKAIGVVGALMPKKQQLLLLEYLAAHPDELPDNSTLFFVGDFDPSEDPYSALCAQAVNCASLRSRVELVGYAGAIRDWYCRLDVTLICSRHEGLARAMIESMACGTPVVSFDCCSAREVLDRGDCGLVAPQGQFSELMAHVRRLLSEPMLHQQYSARGIQVARELFEPDAVTRAYEQTYLRLASGSGGLGSAGR